MIVAGALISGLLFSQIALSADPGSVGFAFLKVSAGARTAAMGDAGTAAATGVSGVAFNPAVVGNLASGQVGLMHHENIFDSRREFLGGATPLFGGGIALTFDFHKIGDIEERQGPTEEPIGSFDSQDWVTGLTLGFPFGRQFSAGVTAKYAAEKIESRTADAFLFDAGLQWQASEILTFGVAARNVGAKPKFNDEAIEIPMTLAAGVATSVRGFVTALDVSAPKDSDVRVGIGIEKQLAKMFALRGGYKTGYDEENFTAGAGFTKSIWQIDYAFVPFQSGLGATHRFALTINFNK